MRELIKLCLKTISPIHLGCDEVYEPMGFVVDEEKQQLTIFDQASFFAQLDRRDKQRFSDICRKGTISSILEVYRFFHGKKASGKTVALCPGFVGHYRRNLAIPFGNERSIQRQLNNFAIARTFFNPLDGRPSIPGSAIKGALRTAYLSGRAAVEKVHKIGGARELEKVLLNGGSFSTDPFRMLKVSDFRPIGDVKTRIIYAVNKKKAPSRFQASGPSQILEVVQPGTLFEGSVSIDQPERSAGIKMPMSRQSLFQSVAAFYGKEKSRENRELGGIGIKPVPVPEHENGFLLRVGRHSGAESVTIEGHRRIKIMKGKGERDFLDHATTFWLAAETPRPESNGNLISFGWAVLEEMHEEIEKRFRDIEIEWGQKEDRGSAIALGTVPVSPPDLPPVEVRANREIWERAYLTWSPGNQTLTATSGGKRATGKGKDLVPDVFHKRLFVKRKSVTARVKVEPVGNAFLIVKIEPQT